MRKPGVGALLLLLAGALQGAKSLEIYFIDVEGGQATLFVGPTGDSMLVDAGWGGFNGRDAGRIAAAAKSAGVKKIDYLVVTHYHEDHAGGVPQLAAKLPIRTFVDHGPSVETGRDPQLVNALRPRVAIVNNGARKGGTAEAWQTVHQAPGLEDIWQLHYAVGAPKDRNSADPFIANIDEICQGMWLRVTAQKDGSFVVYNSRNKYEKKYAGSAP